MSAMDAALEAAVQVKTMAHEAGDQLAPVLLLGQRDGEVAVMLLAGLEDTLQLEPLCAMLRARLGVPLPGAGYVADVWHEIRDRDDPRPGLVRGELGARFALGDPAVVEAVAVTWVDEGGAASMKLRAYRDRGAYLEWLDESEHAGVVAGGVVPEALAVLVR